MSTHEYNLIVHHQVRNPRREWYEITEKGKEIFRLLLKKTAKEYEDSTGH